ncbi:hypothetical protein EGR_07992 [Echinococcus granulosus]|uniref:Uncharacterized protein n=1 Tax=Echinococcus granulosus TaxID=6210 RepID=W6U7M4_ECHGR|nr:hypothetical protein EGR_07992 [Echinococcus granulosus]EUB57175.1 hypothetical protein EGR_07992 [Echinococcus granulosus]
MAWSSANESLEEFIQVLARYHQAYMSDTNSTVRVIPQSRERRFTSTVSSTSSLKRPPKLTRFAANYGDSDEDSSNDDEVHSNCHCNLANQLQTTSSDDSQSTGAISGEEGTLPPYRKNRMLNQLQRRFYGNDNSPDRTSGKEKVTLNEALPGYSTGLMPAVYQTTDTSDTFHKEVTNNSNVDDRKLGSLLTSEKSKWVKSVLQAVVPIPTLVDKIREAIGHG